MAFIVDSVKVHTLPFLGAIGMKHGTPLHLAPQRRRKRTDSAELKREVAERASTRRHQHVAVLQQKQVQKRPKDHISLVLGEGLRTVGGVTPSDRLEREHGGIRLQSTSHVADHDIGVRTDKHIQIPSLNLMLVAVCVHVLEKLTEVVLLQKYYVFVHVREVATRSYLEAAKWTGMQDLILFLNAMAQLGSGVEEETQNRVL